MRNPPVTYLLVGLGSGLGASLRLLLSILLHQPDALWPWATLLVNLLGSVLIGFYAGMVGTAGRWQVSEPQKQFVLAGFCGGFTTFSVFSLEGLQLLLAGHGVLAALYVLVSLFVWLL
ncbi:CrcB family protein, partial [Alkalimonas sp.]|uniref:fluoride efflux transporter FluC n=1 Tax=Alkalimonas sp. TaxID=1872453 RepID=UPI002A18EC1B|nr:CrcB family protein [Alkalimonas sp.]